METCDTWRQAHNFSCMMIADLKVQLAALDIPTGDAGGQTSERRAGDRTEGQPADDAEDPEESEEDEEGDEDEDDE